MLIMKTRDHNNSGEKVFIDATIYTFWGGSEFNFSELVTLFILVVGSCLYLVIKTVFELGTKTPSSNTISLVIIVIILGFTFAIIRKYWTFKVTTANNGLTFIGLLKKIHIDWRDISEVGTTKILLHGNFADGNMGKVSTRHGNYYFPLTMIEKDEIFPQLKGQLMNFTWKESDGTTKEITLQNCPLYDEIQKHLTTASRGTG